LKVIKAIKKKKRLQTWRRISHTVK